MKHSTEKEKRDHPAKQGEDTQASEKRKPSVLNICLIIVGILLILLGIVYFCIANYYRTHFLPDTTVNHMDCSNLDADTVTHMVEEQCRNYTLTVTGRDSAVIGVLTADDVELQVLGAGSGVKGSLESQKWLEWIWAYLGKTQYSFDILCGTEFNREKVSEKLAGWTAFDKKHMEQPQNAYISEYQSEIKGYEIIPETRGNLLDTKKAEELILAAVAAGDTKLDLEENSCYLQAEITSEDKALNKRCDDLNLLTGTRIVYDWNGTEVLLDGDTIHGWILQEEQGIMLDEEAVADFVDSQAKEHDTYGKKHKFTTTLGETLTIQNGGYGWKTDRNQETQELIALIQEGVSAEREPVYRSKGAQKGEDDIGSSYVEIDLTHQHLYLYQDGRLAVETDFVSGNMSKGYVTPAGIYGLTYKTKNAVLRGADYETPVNYWMPFNGNIGMHDATWRKSFGGDIYLTNGSHGCINLPLDKAKEIYEYVSAGFPVVCYYY